MWEMPLGTKGVKGPVGYKKKECLRGGGGRNLQVFLKKDGRGKVGGGGTQKVSGRKGTRGRGVIGAGRNINWFGVETQPPNKACNNRKKGGVGGGNLLPPWNSCRHLDHGGKEKKSKGEKWPSEGRSLVKANDENGGGNWEKAICATEKGHAKKKNTEGGEKRGKNFITTPVQNAYHRGDGICTGLEGDRP